MENKFSDFLTVCGECAEYANACYECADAYEYNGPWKD